MCLQNKPLAFVGDSRLRDVYQLLVRQLREVVDEDYGQKAVCIVFQFVLTYCTCNS